MSVEPINEFVVNCDTPTCYAQFDSEAVTEDGAVEEASEFGWTFDSTPVDYTAYCPSCTQKRKEAAQ